MRHAKHTFHVSGPRLKDDKPAPLTVGIPFAEGELPSGTRLALLDDEGRHLPVQTRESGHWHADLKDVQWLVVDTLIPAGVERCHLVCEEDCGETIAGEFTPLELKEDGDYLTIVTGSLRLRFRKSFKHWEPPYHPACWEGLDLRGDEGWEPLLRDPIRAVCADQHGKHYDSVTAGPPPSVELVECGPVRATIKVSGAHSDSDGRRFTPFDWRIHCWAGSSEVLLEHRLIFDQDAQFVQLAQCGLDLPLDLGLQLRGAIGMDGTVPAANVWETLRADQTDGNTCRLTGPDCLSRSGEKLDGFAQLSGSKGAVAVSLPEAWRLHPLGLEVQQDGLRIHSWPDSVEPLSFQSRGFREPPIPAEWNCTDDNSFRRAAKEQPTAPVCFNRFPIKSVEDWRQKEALVNEVAPDRPRNRADLYFYDGRGAAFTIRCRIRVGRERMSDEELQAWQACSHEPLLGIPDPVKVCASGVLGHLHPAGDPQFEQVDRDIATIYERSIDEPLDERFWHGRMKYGQLICGHSHAIYWAYLAYRQDGDEEGARAECGPYNNESNDQILALWCEALRRGDSKLLRLARRVAVTVADMGYVHCDTDRPERVGLMHYHSGHPWTGPLEPCHTLTTGLLAAAQFSGDSWLGETVLRVGDRILNVLEPAGIVSMRKQGGLLRKVTGQVSVLLDCWQYSFRRPYHDAASRTLHWILQTAQEGHLLPNSVSTGGPMGDEAFVQPPNWPEVAWGNRYQMWLMARRHCDSPELRSFLEAEGHYWKERFPLDQQNYNSVALCLAYDLTHDPELAAYANHLLDHLLHAQAGRLRSREEVNFELLWHGGFTARLMNIVADARDRDPEGFDSACANWRERRENFPDRPPMNRPDSAPFESLGRLSVQAPNPITE